jgi:hypothetical protein
MSSYVIIYVISENVVNDVQHVVNSVQLMINELRHLVIFIMLSERIHKPNALRFLVKMWYQESIVWWLKVQCIDQTQRDSPSGLNSGIKV